MKILLISDTEEKSFWDNWNKSTAKRLADIDLVLSAGDLHPKYLEFLVTMLNVPLIYVRGNHDGVYDHEPPEGCEDADGKLIEIECGKHAERQKVRVIGFGGSMRYKNDSSDMYTENEMMARVRKAEHDICKRRLVRSIKGQSGDSSLNILLTHAPCRGYGDMEDLPHMGFECFNYFLNKYSPQLHCYGHVHQEYGRINRCISHPSGTLLINGSGYQIIDSGTL